MTTYNVHIYREMRLVFGRIEADSHAAAAVIARDKPTEEADSSDDCEGENLSALVDVVGDEEYEQSVTIDFESERERKAARTLLKAVHMAENYLADDLDGDDETEMRVFHALCDARADAEAARIQPGPAAPTLLAALKDLMEQLVAVGIALDRQTDPDLDSGQWPGTEGLSFTRARAAIAEAEAATGERNPL